MSQPSARLLAGQVRRVGIDLRSDTVTLPSDEMRKVMAAAPVGDDVYGEDPTVNDLEALAARITGKDGALFVPSGTMGNVRARWAPSGARSPCPVAQLVSVGSHCDRGDEVILGTQVRAAWCVGRGLRSS